MLDILIATKNSYKVDEMLFYLEDMDGINVYLLKDQNINLKIKEDGHSLRSNAEKKAILISQKTPFLTLASDGGVDVPALGEKWNILKTQRNVGENNSDLQKAKNFLKIMEKLKGEDRKVQHYLALALAKDGQLLWSDEKITERGYIVEKLPDENIPNDKWISQIWYYKEFDKVFNKLNDVELRKVRQEAQDLKISLHCGIQKVLDNKWVF